MNECDSTGGFRAQEFPQASWRPGTQAVPGYQDTSPEIGMMGAPLLPSCFLKVTQLAGEPFVENHFVRPLGLAHTWNLSHASQDTMVFSYCELNS